MIISIDGTGLGASKTGTTVYLLEILRVWNAKKDLAHRFVVFTTNKARQHFEELRLDDRFEFKLAPSSRAVRVLWQQFVLPLKLWASKCDVHWGSGFVLPLWSGCRSVVTVHDVTFALFPEVHEPIKRWYFPWIIRQSVRKAKSVIVVSETTKNDLVSLYPCIKPKIEVTLLGARSLEVAAPAHSDEPEPPYILTLGTLEPRKNLRRLLRAWCDIPAEIRGRVCLRIAGAEGWMLQGLRAESRWKEAGVEFLGFVDDTELGLLLKNALAVAYPSLYEGFGLPVIEAMAAGVPVLTSAVGATREVAEGAALLVDPRSEEAIRTGLQRLIHDVAFRQELSRRGAIRARDFSWQKTGDKTLAVLERFSRSS